MNIFKVMQYAANCEANWREFVMGNGYTPMTTFFNDLSVAECFGKKGINDTYKNVIKSWGKNIKYITEFCMCLNHKIWQLYENNEDVAREYDKLWRECCQHIEDNFSGEDLQYYYRVTD
jgi:hypothetical protein